MYLVAQIEHADDAWRIGTEYGILGVLVIGGALCLIAAAVYASRRLLNSNDGIVTLLTHNMADTNERNSKTLEQLRENADRQQTLCVRHATAMDTLDEATTQLVQLHSDPHSPFATRHLTEGGMAACDVLDKLMPESPELVNRVRSKLRGE